MRWLIAVTMVLTLAGVADPAQASESPCDDSQIVPATGYRGLDECVSMVFTIVWNLLDAPRGP